VSHWSLSLLLAAFKLFWHLLVSMFGCLIPAVVTSSRVIGEIDEIGVPIGGAGYGDL